MSRKNEFYMVFGLIIALAACIGTWLAIPQLQLFLTNLAAHGTGSSIVNPLAEKDGIVWDVGFYGNKELKDNALFQGKIIGTRNGIHVDWGLGSPIKTVPIDFFSGRFTTDYHFISGTYCFVFEVDDGAKLFADGKEIRSAWWGYTPGAVYKTPLTLSEGSHHLEFDYYEEFEKSSLHLWWYKDAGAECVTVGHPGIR